MKKLLLLALLSSCAPPAYYVANIYVDQSGALYTQRCAIDSGRNADKPDPDNCRYEAVGPLPPAAAAKLAAPMAPPPGAPPPPPVAPPPPAQ